MSAAPPERARGRCAARLFPLVDMERGGCARELAGAAVERAPNTCLSASEHAPDWSADTHPALYLDPTRPLSHSLSPLSLSHWHSRSTHSHPCHRNITPLSTTQTDDETEAARTHSLAPISRQRQHLRQTRLDTSGHAWTSIAALEAERRRQAELSQKDYGALSYHLTYTIHSSSTYHYHPGSRNSHNFIK